MKHNLLPFLPALLIYILLIATYSHGGISKTDSSAFNILDMASENKDRPIKRFSLTKTTGEVTPLVYYWIGPAWIL